MVVIVNLLNCAHSPIFYTTVVRRRRWARAPVIHAASHFDHKKRVAWVPISMHTCGSFFYNYGAPLGGPSGRRSSATKSLCFFPRNSFVFPRKTTFSIYPPDSVKRVPTGLKIDHFHSIRKSQPSSSAKL